jgi:hypothetical protein
VDVCVQLCGGFLILLSLVILLGLWLSEVGFVILALVPSGVFIPGLMLFAVYVSNVAPVAVMVR